MVDAIEAASAPLAQLTVVGGATRSAMFMQLLADVIGKRLVVPSCSEATLVGAAIVAVAGLAVGSDQTEGKERAAALAAAIAETSHAWVRTEQVYEPVAEVHGKHQARPSFFGPPGAALPTALVCVAERYGFFFRQYAGTWGALSGGMHEVADHLSAQPSE